MVVGKFCIHEQLVNLAGACRFRGVGVMVGGKFCIHEQRVNLAGACRFRGVGVMVGVSSAFTDSM